MRTTRAIHVLLTIAGCSEPAPPGTAELIVSGSGGAVREVEQEPSATYSARLLLVSGYNDESAASTMGWASSSDQGQTWTKCSADNPANCNGKPINFAANKDVTNFRQLMRHPSLAADRSGHVVYVTLADTDGDLSTAERVVALLSIDGGKTFESAFTVNEDSCTGGSQDMPSAVFDHTTSPPTLWIAWRNKTFSTFGGCIRRFFIDTKVSPEVLRPLDVARGIAGMGRDSDFDSQGGLKVAAGDGVVEVVYVNSDHIEACPSVAVRKQAWASVATYDNASSWIDNTQMIETLVFQQCIDGGVADIQNSIRAFDFVRTPTGMSYVIVNDATAGLRLFMNPAAGTKGWQTSPIATWFEWCPNTPTEPNPPMGVTSPVSNWLPVARGHCATPAIVAAPGADAVALPSLTADGDGRLGISYYEAHAAPSPGYTVVFAAIKNPQDPSAMIESATIWGLTVATQAIPMLIVTGFPTVAQPLGAYASIAPRQVNGPLVVPGCTADGTYSPVWVQAGVSTTRAQVATQPQSVF